MESEYLKGRIFDIRRFSTHDGGGIRTTVFLKGCPLSCVWCHNPEGISEKRRPIHFKNKCINCKTCYMLSKHNGIEIVEDSIKLNAFEKEDWDKIIECCPTGALAWDSYYLTVEETLKEVVKDAAFFKYGGGVTLSGGEPLLQSKFAVELLKELKKNKIHTAIETALFVKSEVVEEVLPYLDFIYADLKIFNNDNHKKYTGVTNEQIKRNINLLLKSSKKDSVIIRTPMIPSITDKEENIADISKFISSIYDDVSYEILNYNPLAEAKYHLIDKEYYFEDSPKKYTDYEMAKFRKIAENNGVKNIIIE